MFRTLLFFLPLIIAGCYSNKPTAPLEEAIFDERLLGKWSIIDDEGELILAVSRLGDKEYMVVPVTGDDQDEPLEFFITEVDGERFINAREIHEGKTDEDFMFGRYALLNDNEVIIEVPELDAIPHEVASSGELHRFISENMNNPGFFDDKPKVYHRVAE